MAPHWDRAGEPVRAAEWAIRAADAACAAGDHDEAVAYLTLALDTIDTHPSAEEIVADRADLLLSLAREQYLAGRIGNSLDACERAADDGERSGRPDTVARAAITVQGIGHAAINARIERLCRRALELLGDTGAPDLRARVEAQLVCALVEQPGQYVWAPPGAAAAAEVTEEAARRSKSALAQAAVSGDPDVELDAIHARATDYVMLDAMKIGGVTGWLRASALASAHFIRVSSHLWPELSAHLLAVTPNAHWLEYSDWWNPVLANPLRVENGMALPGPPIEWA